MEPLKRLVHRQLEHTVDRAPTELDLQHVGLESFPAAGLARHEHIGQEHHLDQHVARALARVAPAPGHVEREGARRVAARAGEWLRRE